MSDNDGFENVPDGDESEGFSDSGDFGKVSEQYFKSCQEQMSTLLKNPDMLKMALKPFLHMQKHLSPDMMGALEDTTKDETKHKEPEDDVDLVLRKILHKIQVMRKKTLSPIMELVQQINDKVVRIESHLGIDSQDFGVTDKNEKKDED